MAAAATTTTNSHAAPDASSSLAASHRSSRSSNTTVDPFRALPNDIRLSDLSSPASRQSGQGSLVHRVGATFIHALMTPVAMVSFLCSLAIVDRQQRQWRLSQHPPANDRRPPILQSFSRWSWRSPEPYQDPADRTWQDHGPSSTYNGWFRRKKHRAMAKLEITDAFHLSGRLRFGLIVFTALMVSACAYGLRRMSNILFP